MAANQTGLSFDELKAAVKTTSKGKGIGDYVRTEIVRAMVEKREIKTQDLIADVRAKFGGSFSKNCFSWYKADLRNDEAKLKRYYEAVMAEKAKK